MSTKNGMALVQVLLLSALLMIMLLSVQYQARNQLELANRVQQYSDLQLQLQNVEAELMFLLMTNEWSDLVKPTSKVNGFNFFGKEFLLSGAVVKIQDLAGLLSVNSPNTSTYAGLTKRLLGDEQLGVRIAEELIDWRDADDLPGQYGAEQAEYPNIQVRNFGLQTLDEIRFLKSMTPELYRLLRPYLTVFRQSENLMNMPMEVMTLHVSAAAAEQIMLSRDKGELNDGVLSSLGVSASDESNALRFGRALQITFTVENANVKLTRSFSMTIDPSRPVPFELLEYRMRDTEMENLNAVQ